MLRCRHHRRFSSRPSHVTSPDCCGTRSRKSRVNALAAWWLRLRETAQSPPRIACFGLCLRHFIYFFFSCDLHARYWGTEERSQPPRVTSRPCPLKRVVTAAGNVVSVRFLPVRCRLPAQASLRPPVERPRRGVIATDMKTTRRRRRMQRLRSRNVTCSWLHLSHLFSFPFAAETSGERSSGGTFLKE